MVSTKFHHFSDYLNFFAYAVSYGLPSNGSYGPSRGIGRIANKTSEALRPLLAYATEESSYIFSVISSGCGRIAQIFSDALNFNFIPGASAAPVRIAPHMISFVENATEEQIIAFVERVNANSLNSFTKGYSRRTPVILMADLEIESVEQLKADFADIILSLEDSNPFPGSL
jgi:hypothetical protein